MKKITLPALFSLLIWFAGCNSDEGGSSLKLKIGTETIDLSNANFYLAETGEYDGIEDESSENTHTYATIYISDGDLLDGTSSLTYEAYLYVEFPVDDEPSGSFEMSFETIWDASTRFAYFDVYYDIQGTVQNWGDTYSWVGWDNTDADGSTTVTLKEGDEIDQITIKVSGNMERWDYNSVDQWSLNPDETDVAVVFEAKGDLFDASGNSGAQRLDKHKSRKVEKHSF